MIITMAFIKHFKEISDFFKDEICYFVEQCSVDKVADDLYVIFDKIADESFGIFTADEFLNSLEESYGQTYIKYNKN